MKHAGRPSIFTKIDFIKPYEKNAKKHPAKQIKQVAESIKEWYN